MKDSFLTHINDKLTQIGFIKTKSEKYETLYTFIQTVEQSGRIVIINGQKMNSQNTKINITQNICIVGDGYVENNDGGNHKDFTQICFELFVNKEQRISHEECFYWDDAEYFDKILNNFLNYN